MRPLKIRVQREMMNPIVPISRFFVSIFRVFLPMINDRIIEATKSTKDTTAMMELYGLGANKSWNNEIKKLKTPNNNA